MTQERGPGRLRGLRELREASGFGLQEFARLTRSSTRTVQDAELGKRSPRPATMRKFARALGVKPWEIREFAGALGMGREEAGSVLREDPEPDLRQRFGTRSDDFGTGLSDLYGPKARRSFYEEDLLFAEREDLSGMVEAEIGNVTGVDPTEHPVLEDPELVRIGLRGVLRNLMRHLGKEETDRQYEKAFGERPPGEERGEGGDR